MPRLTTAPMLRAYHSQNPAGQWRVYVDTMTADYEREHFIYYGRPPFKTEAEAVRLVARVEAAGQIDRDLWHCSGSSRYDPAAGGQWWAK